MPRIHHTVESRMVYGVSVPNSAASVTARIMHVNESHECRLQGHEQLPSAVRRVYEQAIGMKLVVTLGQWPGYGIRREGVPHNMAELERWVEQCVLPNLKSEIDRYNCVPQNYDFSQGRQHARARQLHRNELALVCWVDGSEAGPVEPALKVYAPVEGQPTPSVSIEKYGEGKQAGTTEAELLRNAVFPVDAMKRQIMNALSTDVTKGVHGYQDYSKSNRAVEAEKMGKKTATALARALGCSSRAVVELLHPVEWHHTSKYYNMTNYYDEPALEALAKGDREAALNELGNEDTLEEAAALLRELRNWGKSVPHGQRIEGCTVKWLEWPYKPGRGGRWADRAPTERCVENVAVTISGSFCSINMPDGTTIRKKMSAKGFELLTPDDLKKKGER